MRRQTPKYRPRKKPRFYCDENFFPASMGILSKFDVKHAVLDYNFGGRDDKFHFTYARQEKRIILTLDTDYLNDLKYKLVDSFGLIIISVSPPVTTEKVSLVLTKLQSLFKSLSSDSLVRTKILTTLQGWKIWYIADGQKVTEDHQWLEQGVAIANPFS